MRKDMNNLILETPTKEHESQVMEFCEENVIPLQILFVTA